MLNVMKRNVYISLKKNLSSDYTDYGHGFEVTLCVHVMYGVGVSKTLDNTGFVIYGELSET